MLYLMLLLLSLEKMDLGEVLSEAYFIQPQKTPSNFFYVGDQDQNIQVYQLEKDTQLKFLGSLEHFTAYRHMSHSQSGDHLIVEGVEEEERIFQVFHGPKLVAKVLMSAEPFSWVEYADGFLYLGYHGKSVTEIKRYNLEEKAFDKTLTHEFVPRMHFPATSPKAMWNQDRLWIWVRDDAQLLILDRHLELIKVERFTLPYEIMKFDHKYYTGIYRELKKHRDSLRHFCDGLAGEPLDVFPWSPLMVKGKPHLVFHMLFIRGYSEETNDCTFTRQSYLVNMENGQFEVFPEKEDLHHTA